MFNNLIKRQMQPYLRQVELYGEMRRVWAKHVWWTREVAINILNGLPSTTVTVNKLLQNPVEMGDVFGGYYSDRSVRKIEELFTAHLKQGGDIMTAAKAGDMQKVEDLTRAWYANADDIAKFFASINSHYSESEVKRMMYEHLRLTLLEVSQMIQQKFEQAITTFDQIQKEAEMMADYFTRGIAAQFPEKLGQPVAL